VAFFAHFLIEHGHLFFLSISFSLYSTDRHLRLTAPSFFFLDSPLALRFLSPFFHVPGMEILHEFTSLRLRFARFTPLYFFQPRLPVVVTCATGLMRSKSSRTLPIERRTRFRVSPRSLVVGSFSPVDAPVLFYAGGLLSAPTLTPSFFFCPISRLSFIALRAMAFDDRDRPSSGVFLTTTPSPGTRPASTGSTRGRSSSFFLTRLSH